MAMGKANLGSVDEYIAAQPEAARGKLEQVRSAIRKAVPGADELISYKIPAYTLNGAPVLYFAGWKQHISLYPATGRLLAKFNDELEPYKIHKATIRFPISQPIPVKLIARIAKFRAREVAEKQKKSAKS